MEPNIEANIEPNWILNQTREKNLHSPNLHTAAVCVAVRNFWFQKYANPCPWKFSTNFYVSVCNASPNLKFTSNILLLSSLPMKIILLSTSTWQPCTVPEGKLPSWVHCPSFSIWVEAVVPTCPSTHPHPPVTITSPALVAVTCGFCFNGPSASLSHSPHD